MHHVVEQIVAGVLSPAVTVLSFAVLLPICLVAAQNRFGERGAVIVTAWAGVLLVILPFVAFAVPGLSGSRPLSYNTTGLVRLFVLTRALPVAAVGTVAIALGRGRPGRIPNAVLAGCAGFASWAVGVIALILLTGE